MHPKLYSTIILLFCVFTLSSCSKWLIPEDKLEGSWRLAEVERKRTFNTETITTGYENGVFIFNENTTATYTDATGTMTGNWLLKYSSHTSYDAAGQPSTKSKVTLSIKLRDFPSNRFIDWMFDDIDFRNSNNKL